jgi:hypothetical protein
LQQNDSLVITPVITEHSLADMSLAQKEEVRHPSERDKLKTGMNSERSSNKNEGRKNLLINF